MDQDAVMVVHLATLMKRFHEITRGHVWPVPADWWPDLLLPALVDWNVCLRMQSGVVWERATPPPPSSPTPETVLIVRCSLQHLISVLGDGDGKGLCEEEVLHQVLLQAPQAHCCFFDTRQRRACGNRGQEYSPTRPYLLCPQHAMVAVQQRRVPPFQWRPMSGDDSDEADEDWIEWLSKES